LNLFSESTVSTAHESGSFGLEITTDYPWDETISIKITEATKNAVLAVRIPDWCKGYTVKTDGTDAEYELKDGYAYFKHIETGQTIELVLYMPVTIIEANPRIREDIGKIAVKRGPVVYCLEEIDNCNDLHRIYLPEEVDFTTQFDPAFFDGAMIINSPGKKLKQDDWCPDELYREAVTPEFEDIQLKWIPYYLWSNRGIGEMTVWVKR